MAKINEHSPEDLLYLLIHACYDEANYATKQAMKDRECYEREALRRLGGDWEQYKER